MVKKSSGIANQLVRWFLLIAILPLAIVMYLVFRNSVNSLQQNMTQNLLAVATRQSDQIRTYIRERERNVTTLSRMSDIVKAMDNYQNAFEEYEFSSTHWKIIDAKYRPFLKYYQESFGYEDLYLITSSGDAIFSIKRGADLGTNLRTGKYNNTELAKVFDRANTMLETAISDFEFYPVSNEPAAFIASPIFKGTAIIGVVALQMHNDELYKIINDYTGLGKTGETIVAALHGNMAIFQAPTRYDPDAAFTRKIQLNSTSDLAVKYSIQGKKGSGLVPDYRGKETLAVWKYIPDMRWGMVTKIDKQEAYSSIVKLRNLSLAIGIVTVLLVSMAAIFVAKSFSKPILELTRTTQKISHGDLNQKLDIVVKNEIGELAFSFNEMTKKLSESIQQLKLTTAAKERIESELQIARNIQMGILPKVNPSFLPTRNFDLFATVEPAKEVGGDFYDFFFVDDNKLCVVIGDVSGKGVPAALFMAMVKTLIKAKATEGLKANIVLKRVNEELVLNNPSLMFVTLFLGFLNIKDGHFEYSNAGHNPPLLIQNNGDIKPLKSQNEIALGVMDGHAYTILDIKIREKSSLLFYTDGVTDAVDTDEQFFTEKRLYSILPSMTTMSSEKTVIAILEKIKSFSNCTAQSDDITIMVLKSLK